METKTYMTLAEDGITFLLLIVVTLFKVVLLPFYLIGVVLRAAGWDRKLFPAQASPHPMSREEFERRQLVSLAGIPPAPPTPPADDDPGRVVNW
jgi:hypothetical protein